MKKVTIATAIVAAIGFSAYLGFRPTTESELSDLVLANAEAITDIEQIGDNHYIVDKIPCYSAGSPIGFMCKYVSCTTCAEVSGFEKGTSGECTVVRPFPALPSLP